MKDYSHLFQILSLSNCTYLDSAATTQKPQIVLDSIQKHLSALSVNPGRGSYDPAVQLEDQIQGTRDQTAKFINAQSNEIIFTSGATESLNTVAYSWGLHNLQDGDEILLCEEDHESTIKPWFQIQKILKKQDINIIIKYYKHHPYLGNADIESIKNEVSDKTKLIAVTHIHNVHGTMSDIKGIREAVGNDILILLDACQSISHTQIDVKELEVDFLAFSGHKMFALDSIGVLYINSSLHQNIHPFIVGGKSVTNKYSHIDKSNLEVYKVLEAGTPNSTGAISLKAAMDFIQSIGYENIHKHINSLTAYLYERLSKLDNIEFLAGYAFDQSRVGYGLISFRVNGVSSSDIGELLNQNNIFVRTGNHCIANNEDIRDSVRISLHIYNTKEDIDKVIESLSQVSFL